MSRINDPNQPSNAGGATGQIRDKAQEVAGNIREMGGQLQDAAREQYDHLRQSASEYYDQGREKAQEWQHELEDYVREQPVKSILIAAGVGVLFGILWKRS